MVVRWDMYRLRMVQLHYFRDEKSGCILQTCNEIDDDIEFDDDSLTDTNFDTDLGKFIEEYLENKIKLTNTKQLTG